MTFLFTDIEGSTLRWEAYPDAMKAALHEHLTDAEIDGLAAEGAAWSEDRAVEAALTL